jgi:FixJ family two-component response regulator
MVLLDVEMPELDGYQACSELRRLYGEALPIVLITGHNDQRASEAACKAGASDFISKPVNWTTLGERLRPMLAKTLSRFSIRAALQSRYRHGANVAPKCARSPRAK